MSWPVQIFTIFKRIVVLFVQESGEICTGQVILQPILLKSDRLLVPGKAIAAAPYCLDQRVMA